MTPLVFFLLLAYCVSAVAGTATVVVVTNTTAATCAPDPLFTTLYQLVGCNATTTTATVLWFTDPACGAASFVAKSVAPTGVLTGAGYNFTCALSTPAFTAAQLAITTVATIETFTAVDTTCPSTSTTSMVTEVAGVPDEASCFPLFGAGNGTNTWVGIDCTDPELIDVAQFNASASACATSGSIPSVQFGIAAATCTDYKATGVPTKITCANVISGASAAAHPSVILLALLLLSFHRKF